MIIAGEASGDMHGAALVKDILEKDSSINIFGIGGDKMIAEGLKSEYHIKDLAFLGFTEIIRHLPFIKKVQRRLIEIIKENKIRTVVLIDYPGFNLNLAKKLKKLGIKIIYYISPQVWAWGQKRVHKIRRLIDKMLVVFPFEKEFYQKHNVEVEYVGHPLIKRISEYEFESEVSFRKRLNLDEKKEILLILPGSRNHEIEKIFPEVIEAASKISEKHNLQTVVACASNIDETIFDEYKNEFHFRIVKEKTYELMKYSKFGIIKSGTSTLEAGLFKLPFVVVYSTSNLTYKIMKSLIKVDKIAMANIILKENVVPELIQHEANSENIIKTVDEILSSDQRIREIKNKFSSLWDELKLSDENPNAADIIIQYVNAN